MNFFLLFCKRNNAKIIFLIIFCSHYYIIIFLILNSKFTKQENIYGHISYIFIYIFIYVYIYLYIFLYDKFFYHIKRKNIYKKKVGRGYLKRRWAF